MSTHLKRILVVFLIFAFVLQMGVSVSPSAFRAFAETEQAVTDTDEGLTEDLASAEDDSEGGDTLHEENGEVNEEITEETPGDDVSGEDAQVPEEGAEGTEGDVPEATDDQGTFDEETAEEPAEEAPAEPEAPAAPTTRDCPFCCSSVSIKATRCPHCTSVLPEYKP